MQQCICRKRGAPPFACFVVLCSRSSAGCCVWGCKPSEGRCLRGQQANAKTWHWSLLVLAAGGPCCRRGMQPTNNAHEEDGLTSKPLDLQDAKLAAAVALST